jgi:hypothetical protein
LNQLASSQNADRIVLTIGKFAVPDIFDTNRYAHDPRSDFFNYSLPRIRSAMAAISAQSIQTPKPCYGPFGLTLCPPRH